MSSRIAVCGQPPVCDGGDALDRQHAGRAQELGVLGRVDVVGHDAEAQPRPTARRTARRSGCSCRTRRDRRRRSGVLVQLAKSRSLCSRWMGAASSIATAAGAGSGPRSAATARAISASSRREVREPARGHGRIERQQLQRGATRRSPRRRRARAARCPRRDTPAGGRDDAERDRPRRAARLDAVGRDRAAGPHRRRRAQQLRAQPARALAQHRARRPRRPLARRARAMPAPYTGV